MQSDTRLARAMRWVRGDGPRGYGARVSIAGLLLVVLAAGHRVAIHAHLGHIPVLLPLWWAYAGTALTVVGTFIAGVDGGIGFFGDPMPLMWHMLAVVTAVQLIMIAIRPVAVIHFG